jgi:CspA family cold shock protein
MAAPRLKGTVVRLVSDKGFGFIRGEDQKEYFFHRTSVRGEFEALANSPVTFKPTSGPKGSRAEEVESAEDA